MSKLKFLTLNILSILAVSLFFGSTLVNAKEVKASDFPLKSVENYINYLENYNEEDALNLGVTKNNAQKAVEQAEKNLEEFKSLSNVKQEQFLNYLRNPNETIELSMKGTDKNLEINTQKDVIKNNSFSLMTSRSTKRDIEHTHTLKVMGISWTKYKIIGSYEYNSSGATEVLSGTGYVSHNINPTVTNSKITDDSYISGGIYYGHAVFSYKIGVIGTGWGGQIGTVHIKVEGNQYGKTSGSAYKD